MTDEERRPKEKKEKRKKRKRHTEDDERPSKKAATESIADNLKFSVVEVTAESAPAICKSLIQLPTSTSSYKVNLIRVQS